MKKAFFISIMLLYATVASSQGKVWLPEAFVQHAMAGDAVEQYLKPFQFIMDPPDSGLIWTYGAPEVSKVRLLRVVHKGREKWQLAQLASHFYHESNSREYIDRFYNAEVFLSRHGKKLLLEIVDGDNTERIEFVDQVDGQIFTDGFNAIKNLRDHK